MKGKYLITTDNWFFAPDGKQYKAVWGNVVIVEDSYLGIKTNRNSSNWYARVGNGDTHVLVAGCQIHYAVRCEERPNVEDTQDFMTSPEVGITVFNRPTNIWCAE